MTEDLKVGLKIEADGKQAEAELKDTAKAVDELGQESKGAKDDLNDTARAIDRVGNEAKDASGAVDGLSDKFAKAGLSALAFNELRDALGAVVAPLRDLVALSDEYANLAQRIELVAGAGEATARVLDEIGRIAQRAHAPLQSVGELHVRLANALKESGRSQAEILRTTQALSDALVVSGASAQEGAAALTQLAQGLASGALRGDEFNSVAEQMPVLLDALSQSLGVSRGELRAMAADGKLTADVVLAAVDRMAGQWRQAAESMPLTLERALTDLQSAWTEYLGNSDRVRATSEAVASALAAIADHMDTIGTLAEGAGIAVLAVGLNNLVMAGKGAAAALLGLVDRLGEVDQATGKTTGRVKGLGKALRALAGNYPIAIAVIGYELLAAAADKMAEFAAAHSEAAEAAEAAGLRMRSQAQARIDEAREQIQVYQQYAKVRVRTADEIARMSDRERASYQRNLEGLREYQRLQLRIALNQELLGQKGEQSSAQLGRALSGTRKAFSDLKDGAERAQRALEAGVSVAALDAADAFKRMAGQVTQSTTAAQAHTKALDDLLARFEPGNLESIRTFGGALKLLGEDGTLSAEQVRAAWSRALDGLSAAQLQQFQIAADAAFGGVAASSEVLSAALHESLGAALNQLGVDTERFATGMTTAGAQAVTLFQTIAENSQASAEQVSAAFDAAMEKVATMEGLDRLQAGLQQAFDAGRISAEQMAQAMQAIEDKTRGLTAAASEVEQAFRALGVTSQAELQRAADEARRSFDIIRNSGQATKADLEAAFNAYAARVRATGDASRIALLETERAAAGLSRTLNEVGQSGNAAGAEVQTAFDDAAASIDKTAQAAEKAAGKLRQAQAANAEKDASGSSASGTVTRMEPAVLAAARKRIEEELTLAGKGDAKVAKILFQRELQRLLQHSAATSFKDYYDLVDNAMKTAIAQAQARDTQDRARARPDPAPAATRGFGSRAASVVVVRMEMKGADRLSDHALAQRVIDELERRRGVSL